MDQSKERQDAFSIKHLNDVVVQGANHEQGNKKVLMSNSALDNALTQIAIGVLLPNETVEEHCHDTMDEYFYILEGQVEFTLNGESHAVGPDTLVEIKHSTKHSLHNNSRTKSQFLYWGTAIN